MLLTILMATLAACGLLMILFALKEALLPRPRCACHIIYLKSSRPDPAALVHACLWRQRCGLLTGRLIFADCGIDARADGDRAFAARSGKCGAVQPDAACGIYGNEERRVWSRS